MVAITPGLILKAKQRFHSSPAGEFTEGKFRRECPERQIWDWRDAVGAGVHRSGGIEEILPKMSQSHILWLKRKGIQADPRISLVPVNSKEKFQRKRKLIEKA